MPEQLISRNIDPYHNDSSKLYLGYREQDYNKPWAKYFNPNVALISDEIQKGLICSPWASPLGYGPLEAHDRLLRPGYETIENGFVATNEGTTMIAVRTEMGNGEKHHLLLTGEMYDWWFSWHLTDTSRYKLWHPQAHQYAWRNPDELDITHKNSYAERYIGIFSFINEYLGNHCTDLTVAFIDPKELGIEKEKWPETGIETMVCARIGTPGQGHITENFDGKSYLIHQIRRGQDGKRELRSRFWLPAPEGAARNLMVHCGMEMSHLATFLPALFEEFKDTL
ncbi:hypothetical protein ZTR_00453 [Talaromyces verruculosus]|nr:hypothetical protein ZTR_00453 [Talaromyces verruculosus]